MIKKEHFTLHHAGTSHLYLNHNEFLKKYANLDMLVKMYLSMMPKNVKNYKLGAVDSIMSPVICGMLAAKLKKDVVIIKEKKLEHGLESQVYGEAKGEIILVDDVTSSGTLLINAAKALRGKGAKVDYGIISALRDDTPLKNLKKAKIRPIYVATYEEILKTIWLKLKNEEKEAVEMEVKEKGYKWKFN